MAFEQLLNDIGLDLVRSDALSIYRVRTTERRTVVGRRGQKVRDFGATGGLENLGQAVTIRLLTPRGELSELAHPAYGSRLYELIGAPNTATTRNLAKLFVIESLKQERRIEEIVDVQVTTSPKSAHLINIEIRVRPINETRILDLGPFTIEL